MVLAQDMAQASQAADIMATRKYRKDVAKYEQNVIEYEKNIKQEKIEREKQEEKNKNDPVYQVRTKARAGTLGLDDFRSGGIVQRAMSASRGTPPKRGTGRGRTQAEARAYQKWKEGGTVTIGITGLNLSGAMVQYQKWEQMAKDKVRGSSLNKQRAYAKHVLYGGSQSAWTARIAQEDKDRAASQRASVGLRAAGNQEITAAQQAELARLGGGVSPSLSTSSKIQRNVTAGAVGTVALKAQDFPKDFHYMSKVQQQKVTSAIGVTGAGTTSDPFVSQNPNVSLVSKYLKPQAPVKIQSSSTRNQFGTKSKTQFENRKAAVLTQQEQAEKVEAAFLTPKQAQGTSERYTPWIARDKSFYTKEAALRYAASNPAVAMAVGGSQLLMPPEQKYDSSYIDYAPDGKPYQGAVQPTGYVVSFGGKDRVFLTLASAEKYVDRVSKPTSSTPTNFLGELESSLRYADRVDLGDVPKPSDAAGLLQYYASTGLKPIADIAYAGKNLITGVEEPISPSLPNVIFEQGFEVAKKIWETDDWTPTVENKAGKFIMDDPVRSAVQLPAEAALWVTGGKAISLAMKGAGKVATKFGITNPVARISGGVTETGETVYRGIKIRQKPIIGIQRGKIVVGEPKPETPNLSAATLTDRNLGEVALGYGAERSLYYSPKALAKQKAEGFINPLSEKRSLAWSEVEAASQAVKGGEYVGTIDASAFTSSSTKQGEFLLKTSEQLGKRLFDITHGSAAVRAAIEPSLKTQSGKALRMRDLDQQLLPPTKQEIKVASKLTKEEQTQGITKKQKLEALEKQKAIKIVDEYYVKPFPLEKGQSVAIDIPKKATANIGLILTKATGEKEKIFEIVLSKSAEAVKKGKGDPKYILGYKIPFGKYNVAKDYKIKTTTLEYQGLSQTKTNLAYQTYSKTAGQAKKGYTTTAEFVKLDTPAVAKIGAGSGRDVKDPVRRYWEGRQTELNQIRVGAPIAAKRTRAAVEEAKRLHPEIDFSEIPKAKVVLNLSSKTAIESAPLPKILVAPVIGGRGVIETSRAKIEPRTNISNRVSIKPREQSQSIKIQQKESSFLSKRIESSKSKSIFDEESSLELYSTYKQSQSIGSSKSQSVGSKTSSFLKSITSAKPISSKGKVPVSGKPSVISHPSERPSLRPSLRRKSSKRISSRASAKGGISIVVRIPIRKTAVPIILDLKATEKKRKKKELGEKDFLGNTRLDRIVGLINRKEIMVGDKRTQRQVQLDKKLSLNPKKKQRRKRQGKKRDSDSPIRKGWKI